MKEALKRVRSLEAVSAVPLIQSTNNQEGNKMKKRVLTLVLGAAMITSMMAGAMTVTAAEAEALPGGGSNIMYVITPSVSNPAFKTEADIATKTAEELGYEVKTVSHDDDPTKQSFLTVQSLTKQLQLSVIMLVQTLQLKQ